MSEKNASSAACEFLGLMVEIPFLSRFLDKAALDGSSVRKHCGCQYKVTAIFAGAAVVNKK